MCVCVCGWSVARGWFFLFRVGACSPRSAPPLNIPFVCPILRFSLSHALASQLPRFRREASFPDLCTLRLAPSAREAPCSRSASCRRLWELTWSARAPRLALAHPLTRARVLTRIAACCSDRQRAPVHALSSTARASSARGLSGGLRGCSRCSAGVARAWPSLSAHERASARAARLPSCCARSLACARCVWPLAAGARARGGARLARLLAAAHMHSARAWRACG